MSTLKNHILLRHPWSAAIIGFLSIHIVWFIPSVVNTMFHESDSRWFSFTYTYGDPIVLPLFNALSFFVLAKNNEKIPRLAILGPWALAIFLVLFFEPDASYFRENGSILEVIKGYANAYHSGFIVLEFGLIIFMCWVYPLLPKVYKPWPIIAALIVLIEIFLIFVFVIEDNVYGFPLWKKTITWALLSMSFVAFALNRKFNIIEKIKRRSPVL